MKRTLLPAVLIMVGLLLAGCGSAPPLRSEKYLDDTSFISQKPCGAPCFQGITVGKTTFQDALNIIKSNPMFGEVQSQDNPPQAAWKTRDGEPCCQIQAGTSGVVDGILVRVAPRMTVKQVIDTYGEPKFVVAQDYTPEESALALLYPSLGTILWAVPGNPESTVTENTPITVILYLDPTKFDDVMATAALNAWEGFNKPYAAYKTSTPIQTPRITLTPAQ